MNNITPQNYSDVSWLNEAITKQEKEISKLYQTIGQTYYENHKDDINAENREIIERINNLENEICQYRERLRQLGGAVKCAHCGSDVPPSSTFCIVCGAKMETKIERDEEGSAIYCGNCGTKNSAYSTYCGGCGEVLGSTYVQPQPDNRWADKEDKRQMRVKIGIAIASVAVVIAIVVGFVLYANLGYNLTVHKYMKSSINFDVGAIIELIPENVMDYITHEEDVDIDEIIEESEEALEDIMDDIDGNLRFDYEIIGVKTIKGYELNQLKESYEDIYVDISAAKKVRVNLSVIYDGEKLEQHVDLSLIRIGLSWYLDVFTMGPSTFDIW